MEKERPRIVRHAPQAASSLCLLLLAAQACSAGADASRYWAQIRKADAQVRSSQVSWRVLITISPNRSVDTEKVVADFERQARSQGEHPADIEAGKAAQRATCLLLRGGYSSPEQVEFKYDGKVTRCDVMSGDLAGPGAPKPDASTRGHFVDIYDGTDIITLAGVGNATPTSGSLARGPISHALQHGNVYFGKLVFLAGAPITNFFSPSDTTITAGAGNVILLEKHPEGNNMPFVRLAVSKSTWRPVALTGISPFTGHSLSTCTVTGYRNVSGIVIPSAFSVKQTTQLGVVLADSEYHLVSAAFNEEADVADLKSVVPAGTSLDDFRFGHSTPQYQVGDHIPTDNELRGIIAHFDTQATHDRRNFLWLPTLVALFLALGSFLLIRGRRAKRGTS